MEAVFCELKLLFIIIELTFKSKEPHALIIIAAPYKRVSFKWILCLYAQEPLTSLPNNSLFWQVLFIKFIRI
jgi:hypothetical protein